MTFLRFRTLTLHRPLSQDHFRGRPNQNRQRKNFLAHQAFPDRLFHQNQS